MIPHPIRRLSGVACAAALSGAALLGTTIATAPAASARPVTPSASSIGGRISQTEVLARLKNWYDRKIPYSQGASASDLGNTKKYRTDCAGYADMALHTTNNYTTDTMATSALFHKVMSVNADNRLDVNTSTIRTGDVFIDNTGPHENHHMFIFGKWNSNHSTFSYWNFGGGSSGTAPPEYYSSVSRQASQWAFKPANDYIVYRYENVTS